MGDIMIVKSGDTLSLKTKMVNLKMSHWHLDTYLLEYEDWGMREFANYNIGADGNISSLEFLGLRFMRKDDK